MLEDGVAAGALWIGPVEGQPEAPGAIAADWWVWEIEIAAASRGRGLGRAAMLLAEAEVLSAGGRTLGLNVFGGNAVARGLYESLGYGVTQVRMRKDLS